MRLSHAILSCCLCAASYAQSDRIRVYFNQDTDPSVSAGTLAISLHGAMDDTLEAYIDRAMYTIDVAVYNANDYSIMYALNDARDRGVQRCQDLRRSQRPQFRGTRRVAGLPAFHLA